MGIFRRRKKNRDYFDPEDAFLDSSEDAHMLIHDKDSRIIKSLTTHEVKVIGFIFTMIIVLFTYKVFALQIINGEYYKTLSKQNRITQSVLFAERGIIFDRLKRELAWNEPQAEDGVILPEVVNIENILKLKPIPRYVKISSHFIQNQSSNYSLRHYITTPGLSHLLGFVTYPEKDKSGRWWRFKYKPHGGVEESFNQLLDGKNGYKLIERDAHKTITTGSDSIIEPKNGLSISLTVDAELTSKLYSTIKAGVERSDFKGGAGVIMNVHTGEIVAITSYPEFHNNDLVQQNDTDMFNQYNKDSLKPFLNRAIQGTYTPGSIIKPYMGASALQEGIITEHTKILSTGVLRVPNPYHPGQYTTFKDWRTGLGYLDIRNAIRMSSSIFFYIIGGGHDGQPGLGISRIVKWANEFQFGQKTNIALQGEQSGVVPTPRWKKRIFGEDTQWTLGNTYHASIGQYGWLVTPIQAVKYIASIANGGKLYHPILTKQPRPQKPIHVVKISEKNFEIIREGMRNGARSGTAQALNIQDIHIAAKTGTAQLGRHNEFMNSWVVGYWPFDYSTNGTLSKHNRKTMEPQFAFAVVLEKGPAGTMFGAAPSMRPFFEWLVREHGDDYVLGKYPARVKDITTTNK